MNRLSSYQRAEVIRLLVEGMSIRATCRTTGVAKGTVLKLLANVRAACADYHWENVRNLNCRRVQADEIWSFVYSKAKNVPTQHKDTWGYGDVWTWTAIDADSKLCVSYSISDRTYEAAAVFMDDIASRLANRVQLTTDGHGAYLDAVYGAFGNDIDYGQLIKRYGQPNAEIEARRRYSPTKCIGAERRAIIGSPEEAHTHTAYVERQNLTMRMGMRRFTPLTNAFSKKAENLAYAVALHFHYYNFARPHQTLKGRTPAMAAGLADHVWTVDEIVEMLEQWESADESKETAENLH